MIGTLLSVPPLRLRGFGASGSRRATAFAAALNAALIASGFVRFLLALAVSLTARVLSFSLVLSVAVGFVSPWGRA
jgi:hypothetical protein